MENISAHGGLVHVILEVYQITKETFTVVVQNSPNLITCHVYTQSGIITEDFIVTIQKDYSFVEVAVFNQHQTKIFSDLLIQGNMDFFSFWRDAPHAL